MTIVWTNWELEEENSPNSVYQPVPRNLRRARNLVPLAGFGRGEIRAHNLNGIRGGQGQLAGVPGTTPRILITYLPVDANNRPVNTGRPDHFLVMATHNADVQAQNLLEREWFLIGSVTLPAQVAIDLGHDRALVGNLIEPYVRDLFNRRVLLPSGRQIHRGTGGNQRGSDVRWNELADFYGELGRQAKDPFYAELAASLR